MKVFVGGPRAYKALPRSMQSELRRHVRDGDEFLVGDRPGTDALVQRFLAEERCGRVTVYACGGDARRNLGGWEVEAVDAPRCQPLRRTSLRLARCDAEDRAMALDADVALMAWDRTSRGTFIPMVGVVALGKPCAVVGAGRGCTHVGSFDGIRSMLPDRNPGHRPADVRLSVADQARVLGAAFPSRQMVERLATTPLSKAETVEILLGSPIPLRVKLDLCASLVSVDDSFHEVVDDVEKTILRGPGVEAGELPGLVVASWNAAESSSFTVHRDAIALALGSLESTGPGELIYRKTVWDEQPDLFEEHERGIAPFANLGDALADLRLEMEDEEWDEDTNRWGILEKWKLGDDGRWAKPYTFYTVRDEPVFFESNRYDGRLHCWTAADSTYAGLRAGGLNVHTPFVPGDIVTLDVRPFAPLAHGLVLLPGPEGRADCCYPRALVRYRDPRGARWTELGVGHGGGLHISLPGYSPLYRMETYAGELREEDRVLAEVRDWIAGDARRAASLAEALAGGSMDDDGLRAFMASCRVAGGA